MNQTTIAIGEPAILACGIALAATGIIFVLDR
jgi:hypothetical protein